MKTLIHILTQRVKEKGNLVACRRKIEDKWEEITWSEFYSMVKWVALWFLKNEMRKGDVVSIISNTRMEWSIVDMASFAVGIVNAPIYPNVGAREALYIIKKSNSKTLFLENLEQLEKYKSISSQTPMVRNVVIMDLDGGLSSSTIDGKSAPEKYKKKTLPQWTKSLDQIIRLGREIEGELEEPFEKLIPSFQSDDLATIVYTSGTTGPPKGVMLTHGNIMSEVEGISEVLKADHTDSTLTFLPLAHLFGRIELLACMYRGFTINYAQSLEMVGENLREVKPTMVIAVPRFYEKIYARVLRAISAGSPIKKLLFNWAVHTGKERSRYLQEGRALPQGLRLKYAVAKLLIFKKLHKRVGGRVRFFLSGGAPLSRDIIEFFHAMDLLILEGYGLTESTAAATLNREEFYRFGTVGVPIPGVSLKLKEDGEILIKGDIVFPGYYKDPEATKMALDADGWLHTGDIGEMDTNGYLKIIDRKKDIIITSAGKNISPQNIENLMQSDKYINQIACFGDKRKYITAVITLNEEDVIGYLKENDINFEESDKLHDHKEVIKLLQKRINSLNQNLASYEQIKKFRIIPEEFTVENGLLTPSMKIKRKEVYKKYKNLIDSMYDEIYE